MRKKIIEYKLCFFVLLLASQCRGVLIRIFETVWSILIGFRVVRQGVERAKLQRVDLGAAEMILGRAINIRFCMRKQLIINLAGLFQLSFVQ